MNTPAQKNCYEYFIYIYIIFQQHTSTSLPGSPRGTSHPSRSRSHVSVRYAANSILLLTLRQKHSRPISMTLYQIVHSSLQLNITVTIRMTSVTYSTVINSTCTVFIIPIYFPTCSNLQVQWIYCTVVHHLSGHRPQLHSCFHSQITTV